MYLPLHTQCGHMLQIYGRLASMDTYFGLLIAMLVCGTGISSLHGQNI